MKLKSLTLSGFKSFPEKTAFEFHDGVTCIVGPNGCGKSNVVDAVKWVLGEQSAKSLRGGEMMDVIFNGTAQRRSAGYAEVTLVFEDAAGVLRPGAGAGDGQGVSVSRRLFRSGQSEYLINNAPARLKDVREMFLDTGVGADAYSLIEQGKVETFLQASMDERRALFDEAAGISRYKVRRREAARRLERVEQNLLRLSDVLGEVQKRLRSIKYQAGKARSYQQYTARLKELRSLFALAEYHRLSGQRRQVQGQADAATDALAQLTARLDRLEASRTASETELGDLERRAHDLDGQVSTVASQVLTCRQRAEMLQARSAELGDAILADASRCEQTEGRIEASRQDLQQRRAALEALEADLRNLSGRDQDLRARCTDGACRIEHMRTRLEDEKNGTIDLLRRTAQLHNEIHTHTLRRENLHVQRERVVGRAAELARALEDLLARRAAVQAKLDDIRSVLGDSQQRLDQAHARQKELDGQGHDLTARLSDARQALSALASRRTLLEEMQGKYEGVGEGTRRLLSAAREGTLPFIRGLVGDFLEADVAHAAVVEAALGGQEQHLVATSLTEVLSSTPRLKELLAETDGAHLVCLDRLSRAGGASVALPDDPALIARAADWVRCGPDAAPLAEMLLGTTLVVRALDDARRLAEAPPGGWRFVTVDGDVMEPDGRIRLGTGKAAMGVIWRKSELADLARRMHQATGDIAALTAELDSVHAGRAHLEEVIASLRTAVYEAQTERVEHETLAEQLEKQVAELQRSQPLLAEEVRQLAEEIDQAVRHEHQAQERAAELEALRTQRERQIAFLSAELGESQKRQEALSGEVTAVQVALAEARQKHAAAAEAVERLQREGQDLSAELAGMRQRIDDARRRRQEADDAAAAARRQADDLLASRAALEQEIRENDESRATLQQRLQDIRRDLSGGRKEQEQLSAQLGQLRVQLGEVEVRIETLIARTAEEQGTDLTAAYTEAVRQGQAEGRTVEAFDADRDWQAVQQEIADLREKVERLGNVNLDALTEQDELQRREKFLSEQTEDVRASQRQLNDLIRRLNAESRQRFEESFQTVRGHFNDLFRKLFGGGKADVLLTAPDDVLESPVEILARPPGKELRSITLMSGGEKTMTALALLFAFFKARPSPFCLLDEVDAALDEPNTQRFVALVREFLPASQFVVISHAKRTIATADQIYGVTMQEPGVSTRISVRFEDATKMVEPAQPAPASA